MKYTPAEKRTIMRMTEAGTAPAEIAESIGSTERAVQVFLHRSEALRIHNILRGGQPNDQLCWKCRLSSGRPSRKTGEPCPWVPRGSPPGTKEAPPPPRPVEGWDATPASRLTTDGKGQHVMNSFNIRGCPLYEEDE